ncbi:MAG: ABC transporter permease [Candidatus Aminicenantes bacterium]|nr:ABC transporter permease [Candidatus Aminicenantes bacterium]
MFGNYLKSTLRNIKRHKGYAFINIAGLAIGMACCLLIIMYIAAELSYDRYHENADRIFRLGLDANMGGTSVVTPISNVPSGPAMVQSYPEVIDAVRFRKVSKRTVKVEEKIFYENGIFFTDHSIFQVFSFRLLQGDPAAALKSAYTVVLTEETARRYFGSENPLGKRLNYNDQYDLTVTGVMENVPRNSHFTFDMLCSFETLYDLDRKVMEVWLNFNSYTYLLLAEGADYQDLEKKFPGLVDKHMGNVLKAIGGEIKFFLQPLTSIHLHSNLENEIQTNSDIAYVYIFIAIAVFILAIACINFMNLATARSALRAREIGIRKVIGAERRALVSQFLGESLMYSACSLLIAIPVVWLALPFVGSLSGRELSFHFAGTPWLILGFFGLVLWVGFAAGSYPALFLSAFRPTQVLKGNLKAGTSHSRLRSFLVVAQFIISISLIIGTTIILRQIHFMKNKNLGFNKNNVLVVDVKEENMRRSLESIKTEMQKVPGVESCSSASLTPGYEPDVQPFVPEGFTVKQAQLMESFDVDHDFFPTLGMEIVKGRNFSPESATGSRTAIINETAVKRFDWDDPVGKTIRGPSENVGKWERYTVVGVVKDFHRASLHSVIAPQFISNDPESFDMLIIRINPRHPGETLKRLSAKWEELHPNHAFEFQYLDALLSSLYGNEERLSDIFASFSVFAIFIACLGLFGMASFAAEQRTKEIGIRKVLGATVPGVLVLLAKDFLKLIVAANIIAWPLAYFGMNKWIQHFAYKAGISVWIFVFTGMTAMGIALATVSYQSLKAAFLNPADAIKYE